MHGDISLLMIKSMVSHEESHKNLSEEFGQYLGPMNQHPSAAAKV